LVPIEGICNIIVGDGPQRNEAVDMVVLSMEARGGSGSFIGGSRSVAV